MGYVSSLEYDELDREIKSTMGRSAGDAVRLGYLLRRMLDERLWEARYDCFDEYVLRELHMDYTMASRFIGINRKYSVGGGSPDIDTKWEGYSQTVLIEMLNMPPELQAEVTPDMTVRQVREVKRRARRERPGKESGEAGSTGELPACGAPAKPEGTDPDSGPAAGNPGMPPQGVDPDTGQGRGDKGHQEADMGHEEPDAGEEVATPQLPELARPDKGQSRYLDDFAKYFISFKRDWMLADFENRVSDVTKSPEKIKGHLGKDMRTWYFPSGRDGVAHINLFDDYVQLWDGKGNHIGDFDWFYLAASIQGMWNVVSLEMTDGSISGEPAGPDGGAEGPERPEGCDRLARIRRILAGEKKTLDEYLAVGGLPEELVFKQETIVAALTALVRSLEDAETGAEPEGREQPPLPPLKNAARRREWLNAYRDWGLWYRDGNIGAEYYKYDFDNGARLIAEVYREEATEYCDAYESCYLHLVGGPEAPKDQYGCSRWERHERYSRYPNSETGLAEFLKEVQRNG